MLVLELSKLIVEANNIFLKYATGGRFLYFSQIFELLLRLTKWTYLDNSNANIFYLASITYLKNGL
jgi:hypothetical protein